MTIVLATAKFYGNVLVYSEGTSTADNEVVVQSGSIIQFNTFEIMSTAGAMDVTVSLDGTNYSTAPLSLTDMGAAASAPVIVSVANRVYGFKGYFAKIRVLQNGSTGLTAVSLICGRDFV
ncbi:hypothetical protein LCGC14_1983400 [marine sediment metagenome]|uniref:Uncharacterized protein n=1 Tax=marine sediment metagenome TaxID=412755 RepID=A0A0F9I5A4_9ZZZZ